MNAPNVRSVTVRLNAEVAKYIADIKAAGKATDQAFDSAHTKVSRFDDDLGSATKSADGLAKQTKQTSKETSGLGDAVEKTTRKLKTYNLETAIADERSSRLRTSLRDQARAAVDAEQGLDRTAVATERLSTSAGNGSRDIDKLSGRLGIFRDLALTLGPSLVPIGAVAIPAVTGLANQFGFAAIAAGTAVLAFQGVGDALTAVNKASLQPTGANIAKAHLAMQQISPVARDMVKTLAGLKPVFDGLRDTAAEGLFPGVIEGFESLEKLAPQVEKIVHEVSSTLGDLFAEGADSLASDRWAGFFDMIATDARPVLTDMAHSIGDVAHGLAELWMAFQPLNRDFGSWLADSADAFDRWATGLSETQGFEDFIGYIRENGPRVADAMASIGNALVEVVQAVAPLGGPSLAIISAFADSIAAIAGSPAGPALLGIAAGMAAISRATRIMGPGLASMSDAFLDLRTSPDKAKTAIERFGGAAKAVAGGAGIALFASSLTESNDQLRKLESVAGGALAGFAVGGPWGAGIGAIAGLLVGMAGGADEAAEHVKALVDTLDQATGAITDLTRSTVVKSLEDEGVLEQAEALGVSLDTVTEAALGNADALDELKAARDRAIEAGQTQYDSDARSFNQNSEQIGQYDQLIDKLENQSGAVGQATASYARMRDAMGDSAAAADEYTNAMDHAAAATDSLRGPLFRAHRTLLQNQRVIGALKDRIADANEAIAQQAGEWGDYSQKVDLAGTSIDTIIARMKKLAEAATNEAANIQTLLKDGFDEAAIQNLIDTLGPQGAALAIDQLANGGKKLRESFLHAFDGLEGAEGKVENALRGVDEGITGTRHKVRELQNENVDIKATLDTGALMNQANRADSTLNNLGRQHPKPKATLDPTDLFNKARTATNALNTLDRQHPNPKVTAETSQAMNAIHGVITAMSSVHDKVVHINVVATRNNLDDLVPKADGGEIMGQRQPYGDKVIIAAAPGEEIISNRNGEADQFRRDRAAGRIPAYAAGGTVNGSPSVFTRSADNEVERWSRRTALALKGLASTAREGGADFESALGGATSTSSDFDSALDDSTDSVNRERKAREKMLQEEIAANEERISALQAEKQAIEDSITTLIEGSAGLWDSIREAVIPEIGSDDEISWEDGDATFDSASEQLQFQFNNAQELSELIRKLKKKGFDGPALAALLQSASIETIRDFANQTRDELAAFEQQYADTQHITNQVGHQGAAAVGVTGEIRELRRETRELRRELQELNRHEKHAADQRDDQTRATKDVGEDVARNLNRQTRRAMTGARRSES